jgi:DNA-binding transcriptional MerR regulator
MQDRAPDDRGARAAAPLVGTWPHQLSHEPLLRVSDMLAALTVEFPTVTTSKLRFLDAKGLVSPQRSAAGYRQYSPADVERLRFVLRQQRDHYRPLSVIGEHLLALDEGRMREHVEPRAVGERESAFVTAHELAALASVSVDTVNEAVAAGLFDQAVPGRFSRDTAELAAAFGAYLRAGGDARAAMQVARSARREVDRANALAAPRRSRGDTDAAEVVAEEFTQAAIAMFGACVRAEADR